MSEDLQCPSCKVVIARDPGILRPHRQNCPYCGCVFDGNHRSRSGRRGSNVNLNGISSLEVKPSSGHMRRSASASLPALEGHAVNGHVSNGVKPENRAIGGFLVTSLGRVTLGSLGFTSMFESERLPYLVVDDNSKNKLVQNGSGNVSPNPGSAESKDSKRPNYPTEQRISRSEFSKLMSNAKKSKEWGEVEEFYSTVFQSPSNLCGTFKRDVKQNGARLETPDLRDDLINSVMDKIEQANASVQKTMLKAVVNCLLEVESAVLYHRDYARTLFILLQNPIFTSQSTYTILAHLLQHLTGLPNGEHQLLVHWFRTLTPARFRSILRILLQFVTIRQFPPADKSLPPLSKSRWWIPTATKVLALLNASNNLGMNIVEYNEFYNVSLDHMDLMAEYYTWQNPDRPGQFSFCQYPFILSIVAKRHILTKDSEQQMILTARRSLIQKMARNQAPKIEIFFLNISVRRAHIVSDSLKEISDKQRDLKKKLKVSFVGEPGLDMGGLTKEWFQLLVRQIFEPDYGMFVYHSHSRCYWFSVSGNERNSNLREYNLIGVLMGLAVYNSIILDLHFPSVCYRKLLTPPVVPAKDDSNVGIVNNPNLDDLGEMMPDVAHSMNEILEYKGDVADDLMLTFEVSVEEYGKVTTRELVPNGRNKPVNNENRAEFVRLYLDWLLNNSISEKFRAFYLGFHSVCASNALIMLRPEEVEQLVCGCPTIDLGELRKVTYYDGYKQDDKTIQHFWQILDAYSEELQKKFLLFTTGSDRVPVGGMGEMTFKITKLKDKPDNLPEAHTCFNQLVLPDYKDKEVLKKKLTIAISNAEGFGLE